MKHALAALWMLFMFSPEAGAVLPSLVGPLKALIAILPQLAVVAIASLGALLGFRRRPAAVTWIAQLLRRHRRAAVVAVAVLGGGVLAAAVVMNLWTRPTGVPSKPIADEPSAHSWPTFRGNMRRSGRALDSVDTSHGPLGSDTLWTYVDDTPALGDFSSSPALVNGRVYIGSAQATVFSSFGVVYCLDATDGQEIWQFRTEQAVFSSPAVEQGLVFIGEGLHRDVGSRLHCLDAGSGDLIWDFPTASHVESSPTVADGKVIFGAGEDGVYCLSTGTGELVWHFEGVHVDSSPAVVQDVVVVGAGYEGQGVHVLDLETGDPRWAYPTDYPVWGSPSVLDDRVYVGVGNGNFMRSADEPYGAVLCVDIRSQREVWTRELQDSVLTAPAVTNGRVYVGSRDGGLYCLRASDGKELWRYEAGTAVLSSPAVLGNVVYGTSEAGDVFALDADDGSPRWSRPLDVPSGLLSSPAVSAGQLVLGGSDGSVYCLGDVPE